MYFKVDKNHPEAKGLRGDLNCELLHQEQDGYSAHLAPGFHQPEKGVNKRLSREGNGDIVIEGLSRNGWRKVTEVFDSLDVAATRAQIANAIIQKLDWITWERQSSGN